MHLHILVMSTVFICYLYMCFVSLLRISVAIVYLCECTIIYSGQRTVLHDCTNRNLIYCVVNDFLHSVTFVPNFDFQYILRQLISHTRSHCQKPPRSAIKCHFCPSKFAFDAHLLQHQKRSAFVGQFYDTQLSWLNVRQHFEVKSNCFCQHCQPKSIALWPVEKTKKRKQKVKVCAPGASQSNEWMFWFLVHFFLVFFKIDHELQFINMIFVDCVYGRRQSIRCLLTANAKKIIDTPRCSNRFLLKMVFMRYVCSLIALCCFAIKSVDRRLWTNQLFSITNNYIWMFMLMLNVWHRDIDKPF